jgi:hypothetical protein
MVDISQTGVFRASPTGDVLQTHTHPPSTVHPQYVSCTQPMAEQVTT